MDEPCWCPTCRQAVPPGPELHVAFSPQAWTLNVDGTLDTGWGADVFIDYSHLACGTKVRMTSHCMWDEAAGTYVDGPVPTMIEIDSPDGATVLSLEGGYFDAYDADTDDWIPTFAALQAAYLAAVAALVARLGEEP